MISTLEFAVNGLFAIVLSSFVIFPISTLLKLFSRKNKIEQTDLRKKIAVITGGNTGIGKYTAINLVRRGCTVIIACRVPARGREAVNDIQKIVNSSSHSLYPHLREGTIDYLPLDLSILPSIDAFSRQFRAKYSHLDFLINNGGINTKGTITLGEKQIEQLFGVNYLGHYYLFRCMQDLLQTPNSSLQDPSLPSRVVNLSSVTHHQGSSNYFNSCYYPTSRNNYNGCSPYADSKLYMNYLTLEINKRFSGNLFSNQQDSSSHLTSSSNTRNIISVSVNPGAVKSDIWRSVPPIVQLPYNLFMSFFYLTTEQGCETSLSACIIPLDEIIHHSTQSLQQQDNSFDLLFTRHKFIPYLIPYRMYWRCLAFEMINAFSGSHWGYISLPANSENVSSNLWTFSCDLINNSLNKRNDGNLKLN